MPMFSSYTIKLGQAHLADESAGFLNISFSFLFLKKQFKKQSNCETSHSCLWQLDFFLYQVLTDEVGIPVTLQECAACTRRKHRVTLHRAEGEQCWEGTFPRAQAAWRAAAQHSSGFQWKQDQFLCSLKRQSQETTKHCATCADSPCYSAAVGRVNGTVSHASFWCIHLMTGCGILMSSLATVLAWCLTVPTRPGLEVGKRDRKL